MTRRIERINGLIRAEISDLLRRQVKDPRLGGLVTITEVETSPDLSHAKVFVSIMGSDKDKTEVLSRLNAAAGFFRKELSSRLSLRHVPELSFRRDDSIEQGARILEIINRVTGEGQTSQN